jgi:hypothetical protein
VRRDETGMKEGMREPYIEGVAIHGGPEPCVGAREDAGEALAGERAGRAIEPRNGRHPGCRRCLPCGRPHRGGRKRESSVDPARSENQGMHGTFMRENRESPPPPAHPIRGGPLGEG